LGKKGYVDVEVDCTAKIEWIEFESGEYRFTYCPIT